MALAAGDGGGPRTFIRGPLTAELADARSPVRRFLEARFGVGLRDVQRRYREDAPDLVIPPVPRDVVSPGTLGAAADWLLRFMLHPAPSLELAITGAGFFSERSGMVAALAEIARSLGISGVAATQATGRGFAGPVPGSDADPESLARACWVLSLLTEVFRVGQLAAASGPLNPFLERPASAAELLDLAPPAALDQLAAFRQVFQAQLIPALALRPGQWHLGPTFTGSRLIRADADLIAAGLLIDLKTSAARPSLGIKEAFQLIGYALLDFDDDYRLDVVGILSARYAFLATWDLRELLDRLAGHAVTLPGARDDFRRLLRQAS
ncbi:MAG TPA: hypothetical protein VMG38_00645 [Trebonia sp.]|nr:hypothetical protein [Trebonia sp.]